MQNPEYSKTDKKKDAAVAVVIGSILLLVIASTVLSSYLLWFIPYNESQNTLSFYDSSQNSFLQLQTKLNNTEQLTNAYLTQSFPLGISGTPPFTQGSDTSLMFLGSNSFRETLNYSVTINQTGGNQNIINNLSAGGEIGTNLTNSYVNPEGFWLQGNAFVTSFPASGYATLSGTLPIYASNNAGALSLGISAYNLNSANTSKSGTGSTLLSMQYKVNRIVDYTQYQNITTDNLTNPFVEIRSITLNSLSFSIYSLYYKAWNRSLYQTFGGGAVTVSGYNSTWDFSQLPLMVTVNSVLHSLTVSLIPGPTVFRSLNLNYYSLDVLSL